jgi:O-antigen/teichoic acid export membrane protein
VIGKLERNTFANLGGTVWSIAVGLLCVPLFIRMLGAEAFGLTGLFLTLQGAFAIFDLGIGATLNREIARLDATGAPAEESRDLLFTLQAIYWGVAILIGVAIVACAPLIARHWVHPQALSVATVERCVRLMGIAIALQFPFVLYQCGLLGLQRHVLFNGFNAVISTLRAPGILLLLWLVAPVPEEFFVGQVVVSAMATSGAALLLWRVLASGAPHPAPAAPPSPRKRGEGPKENPSPRLRGEGQARSAKLRGATRPIFRRDLLQKHWRFGASYSANALANMALLQGDKLILSAVLPLSMFGYYSMAQRLASGLYAAILAVDGAVFPRFSAAAARGDEGELARTYHRACQLMAVLLAPLAAVTAFFAREILQVWTGDAVAVARTHAVLVLLVAGMLLHALAQGPIFLQIAHDRWRLISVTNVALLLTILPAYVAAATLYGAAGAAAVWVVLNLGYLTMVPRMRLLTGERRRWLLDDVLLPLAGAVAVVAAAHAAMPAQLGAVAAIAYAIVTGIVATLAAAALSSRLVPSIKRLAFP